MNTRRAVGRWVLALSAFLVAAGWTPVSASLTPSWITEGNRVGAFYGHSVASAGDVNSDGYGDVIVGAYTHLNSSNSLGRAYVYYGSAGGLSTSPAWIAEAPAPNLGFGYSVAGAGDVNGDGYDDVVIGRYHNSLYQGQAWLYLGSPSGLGTSAAWTVLDTPGYGAIVASAGDVNGDGYGDVVVAGDPYGIWIYHGSASGLSPTPALTLNNRCVSVACAGDVNGDGYDDLIIGGTDSAEIHFGSATGLSPTLNWLTKVTYQEANYGISAAGAGDVNGDGFDDVLVGANLYDWNNLTDTGRAFLYYGSAGGPDIYFDWHFDGNLTGGQVANSVASAGDVNGDGFADIVVGASRYDYNTSSQGRAYVFFGSALGVALTPDWVAAGDQALAWFAGVVASAGDVNGDGGSDVIVGADQYQDPEQQEGRAYVYTTSLVDVPRGAVANGLAMAPPFPNPSSGVTDLSFTLPASGRVHLAIHDVTGRVVAVLVDGVQGAGPHGARWRSTSPRVPSGVYVARLEFAGRIETRRIVVIR